MQIDAEHPGIRRIIERIDHTLICRGPDRALAQIGAVTQPVDLVFLFRGLSEAVVDLIERVRKPSCRGLNGFGRGPHAVLP